MRRTKPNRTPIEFVDASASADELEQWAQEALTRAEKYKRDADRMRRFAERAN